MIFPAERQLGLLCTAALVLLPLPTAAEEPAPVQQSELNALVQEDPAAAFLDAFEAGDELTEATFTARRGVGAKVNQSGQRFTRFPRSDLTAFGEWTNHLPKRETGPVAQSCISCHSAPYANGAGPNPLNGIVDPLHTGDPSKYLHRNTPHLFALGGKQRIAEEMTADLKAQEALLEKDVCTLNEAASRPLSAKGVAFGTLSAKPMLDPDTGICVADYDRSAIEGVDPDLVVKVFGWKGSHATLRAFTRHAAHNELGMQGEELVGGHDGDHDGVTNELSVGDLTALTIYMAALERPTSKLELAAHDLMDLTPEETSEIRRGEVILAEAKCTGCHLPVMKVSTPIFSEPSLQAGFKEDVFPSGQPAAEAGLSADTAIWFDLTTDSPNNHVITATGNTLNLGAFPKAEDGSAEIAWYSDFKRHHMGEKLADPIDVHGFGAATWPTASLAGVGSTGPWLHDGNATTLEAAILAHGGDAEDSRRAYEALADDDRKALIAFLENLIIIDLDPEEEEQQEDHADASKAPAATPATLLVRAVPSPKP
ncbi:di-heme oxidoredictase family protein [Roseibium denhamense]|uniref:Di-haem oxidoreductase, putative peroxidase n=1 Tax=Roseibium denhamense TaxID=76305 RepID=A0ABY1P5B4_9HYPH|nr:di-heme oxidoredictase family protein [Roseibium denhamense]SMP26852.1 Di-haem oxidoreductase, putative peroxidase [Roseibium denhamense]